MARIQFASGREQLCALNLSTISGSITPGTYYFWLQGRNAIGYNLPGPVSSVTVGSGQGIRIVIPSDAFRVGESWDYYTISISDSADASLSNLLLKINAVSNSQVPVSLPITIDLTTNANLAIQESVATLPTSGLVNGVVKALTANGNNYFYDSSSSLSADGINVITASPSPGRWLRHYDGVNLFITDTTDEDLGCDTPLQLISDSRHIINYDYALDGSVGKFRRYWIYNTTNTPVLISKRIGLSVVNQGEDVTNSFEGLLKTVFEGYFDRNTDELITNKTDLSPFTYLNVPEGLANFQDNLILERDLELDQAFQIKVYPEFDLSQISSSDVIPALGSELSIIPFLRTDQGVASDLGSFLDDSILPSNSGLRRVYPNIGLSLFVDSGTGIINDKIWKNVPASTALGLDSNTVDQIIAVNSNGSVYKVNSLASNEAERATVSTISGVSKASNYSAIFEADSNPNIEVEVTYPQAIRDNLEDVIAGSDKGSFNAEEIVLFIRKRNSSGGSVVEVKQVNSLVPTNTASDVFTVSYGSGTTILENVIPSTDFGLFSPSAPEINTATLTTGTFFFDVAVAFKYNGNSVTDISHSLTELTASFSEVAATVQNNLYWKAPVATKELLSALNSGLLRDTAIYPVVLGTNDLPSLYMYLAANEATADGDTYLTVNNGPGRFVKLSGGSSGGGSEGPPEGAVLSESGDEFYTESDDNLITESGT